MKDYGVKGATLIHRFKVYFVFIFARWWFNEWDVTEEEKYFRFSDVIRPSKNAKELVKQPKLSSSTCARIK